MNNISWWGTYVTSSNYEPPAPPVKRFQKGAIHIRCERWHATTSRRRPRAGPPAGHLTRRRGSILLATTPFQFFPRLELNMIIITPDTCRSGPGGWPWGWWGGGGLG